MKCRAVTQFIAVGVSVALVILFCFLTQFDAIVGGANLLGFYTTSALTLLTPASEIGYVVWALAGGALLTGITMFINPHREVGKIANRLALFFALANLLGASWILFASYAGGDSPELSWVAFLALGLLWVVNVVMVERADLGMRWRQGPLISLYRLATGHAIYEDDDDKAVEMQRTGSRASSYQRVGRNSRNGDCDDDEDDMENCCTNLIDFSSKNATDLRASYSNGARVVHFLAVEVPIGATFGAVTVLMLATLAQMIDHFSAPSGDVTVATSVLLTVVGLVISLVYSLGKGLHPHAIGALLVVLFQYLKQLELPLSITSLEWASLSTIIIHGVVIVIVSIMRIYHFIRKTNI